MGLVNGALQIGQGALLSYQSVLQVVGNNIANAGVDGYTRQTPQLTGLQGVPLPEGLLSGGGVALTALQRNLNEALEGRLRGALGDEQMNLTAQQSLAQVESLYNELGDRNVSSLMNALFTDFQGLQGNPASGPTRTTVLSAGQALAGQLNDTRSGLIDMVGQTNKQVSTLAKQANDLAQQIAGLNLEIVRAEGGAKGTAAPLRDQRDGVLKQLAQVMNISTNETPEGAVNVFVGNQPLVELTQSRGVTTTTTPGPYGLAVNVCFADNKDAMTITTGQLAGLLNVRDTTLTAQIQSVDNVAATLIEQVNRLHSQGQGLDGFSSLTGVYAVGDPAAALNSSAAGLPIALANGSFKLTVTKDPAPGEDASQAVSPEYVIPVNLMGLGADTSLNDLVSYLNANVGDLTASVTPQGQLQLQATDGYSFRFGQDTSGAVAGLGLNVFFSGRNAADIAVESGLASDTQRLAAAMTGGAGDGSNAARIAALANQPVPSLDGRSIPQQWQSVVTGLAGTSKDARDASDATHSVSQSLQAQRESISGVNTDEEAVSLMQYQRSFQAAARYITIVDQLVNEMLAMVK